MGLVEQAAYGAGRWRSVAFFLGLTLVGCGGRSAKSEPGPDSVTPQGGSSSGPEVSEPVPPGESAAQGGADSSSQAGSTATGGREPYESLGGFTSAGAPAVPDNDPVYPKARFVGGNGGQRCPAFAGVQGIYCFHTADGQSALCQDEKDCNTCLCAVPCAWGPEGPAACPPSVGGKGNPECLRESPPQDGTCMLTCEDGECPPAMTCVTEPTLRRRVCMWVAP